MTYQNESITSAVFAARWISETQGREVPAHIWEIIPHETYLEVRTCWGGETTFTTFDAYIVPNEPAFRINGCAARFKATLIDNQHFVIPNWYDGRGSEEPRDVVFSRPGIAELTAREAYQKFLQEKAPGDHTSPTSRTTSPKGN